MCSWDQPPAGGARYPGGRVRRILDADKEGFLRDARSLVQIIGRAARNVNAKVVLYADTMTDSIKKALVETERRRRMQLAYNARHGITPQTIQKPIREKEVEITTSNMFQCGRSRT